MLVVVFCLLLANPSKFSRNELELPFINTSLLKFLKKVSTLPSLSAFMGGNLQSQIIFAIRSITSSLASFSCSFIFYRIDFLPLKNISLNFSNVSLGSLNAPSFFKLSCCKKMHNAIITYFSRLLMSSFLC